jgi:hypothetical protein
VCPSVHYFDFVPPHSLLCCPGSLFFFFRRSQRLSSLACGLHVRLVITANAVSDSHKVELFRVENIMVTGCQFQETFRQPIVVLFLLGSVVER